MKKIVVWLFSLALFLVGISGVSYSSTYSMKPPSTIHLKIPKPKSKKEAIERIPDYVILDIILPPVIDRGNLKVEVFGKYVDYIDYLIDKGIVNVDELKKLAYKSIKSRKFSLKLLKQQMLSSIYSSLRRLNEDSSDYTFIVELVAVFASILGLLPVLFYFYFFDD